MSDNNFIKENVDIAWCPGCGNFPIRKIVSEALSELNIDKTKLVMVSGIGQAAKSPQYLNVNYFNGLHGRALPVATGIKCANPSLKVIVESGDGDMYGEGGNHFIHSIRRNPDITAIIHNNMVYGLTKGQASPTTRFEMKTPVQVAGVVLEPFNPLSMAISQNATFVARANATDKDKSKEIIKKAINHKGFSIVDIFHVCVSFNKLNNFKWYKDNTYYLDEKEHNVNDRKSAFERSIESYPFPLGIFYINEDKKTFEEQNLVYKNDFTPLYEREIVMKKLNNFINK